MPTGIFSAVTPYAHHVRIPLHPEPQVLTTPGEETLKEETQNEEISALKKEELPARTLKRTVSAPPQLQ